MNAHDAIPEIPGDLFSRAEWYDRTINWSARMEREIPVLMDVFGPPGPGGLLDAGCGTGHQAWALAERGYRVVGADASEEMIEVARRRASTATHRITFAVTPYATLYDQVGGGFDGLYCLGNALPAAGTEDRVADAVAQFSRCLRPAGRLFLQIINFPLMRREDPCVRGPRVSQADGTEHVSVRHFVFSEDAVDITNITVWKNSGWKQRAHRGRLYPADLAQMRTWCDASGLRIDDIWAGYDRAPFDPDASTDLLIAATKIEAPSP